METRQAINKNGVILYRGPSLIDGKPIVVIATGLKRKSKNAKTNDMIQTWILRDDVHPKDAIYNGEDASICGDCPHRVREHAEPNYLTKLIRTCYVNMRTPITIWNCLKRGGYEEATVEHVRAIRKRHVRIGSYGDPAAVPFGVWKLIKPAKDRHRTGYTHQWDWSGIDKRLKQICMASADSEQERERAQAQGWRTFEVRPLNADAPGRGFQCPSDPALETHKSCEDCGACHGAPRGVKASPWIYAHGPSKKRVGLNVLQ
jgi:hypothetical protein